MAQETYQSDFTDLGRQPGDLVCRGAGNVLLLDDEEPDAGDPVVGHKKYEDYLDHTQVGFGTLAFEVLGKFGESEDPENFELLEPFYILFSDIGAVACE